MNLFQLKEYTPDHIVYLYQPEGRGEWGEIVYTFSDDVAMIVTRASENSSWHDRHAVTKVKECAKKNNIPVEFTQAWY